MKALYILLITLLSCNCYAQNGYRTDTKTVFGGVVDLDDTQKGFITVEVQLKADFYDEKVTCVTVVAYKYHEGTIWENAKPFFKDRNWITINRKAIPVAKFYEMICSNDEVPNDIKTTFKSAKESFTLCAMLSSNSNLFIFM